MIKPLCKSWILGGWLSDVTGKDIEKIRVLSIESTLKCGRPGGEVRLAGKDRDEL